MAAGHSAANEAAHYKSQAEQAEFIARTAREMERRYSAAAGSELRLGKMLEPLAEQGYHVLADRKWSNSTKAQVDFVLVGPSGVYIVDAKSWADVRIDCAASERHELDRRELYVAMTRAQDGLWVGVA